MSGIHHPVQQGTVHNEAVTGVGCVQNTSTSMPFCDSSSLSLYLLLPVDDILWLSKVSAHFRLRTSCLKPRNDDVLLINC